MRRPFGLVALSVVALLLANFAPGFAREGEQRAAQVVQEALKAEAEGKLVEREALVQSAAGYDKNERSTNFHSGRIKVGTAWVSYEDVVAANEKSTALQQYMKAREDARPTLASQEALALMCQKLRLKDQEHAHWQAVLQLAPDHPAARQALGYVKGMNGKWTLIAKEQENAQLQQRIAIALKSEQIPLTALARNLASSKISVEEAAAKMAKSGDVALIPAWEQYVSTTSINGALATVGALNKLTAPEASHSLLRHALYHPSGEVQKAAIKALKTRDEQSYLPPLIAALRGPWVGEARTAYDPITRQQVTRYATVSERQEVKDIQVIDDIYMLGGDIGRAGVIAAGADSTSHVVLEAQRVAANNAIDAQNKRIMTLLSALTGEKELATPQEWWKWWEEHSESISVGEKSIETSYAYRTSAIYGEAPPPRPATSGSSPSAREKHECLAAGTLVLTNRGAIGVEQVRLGDLVCARHPASGETALKPVIQTTHRPPEKLLQIALGDDVIRASGGHPFWISGEGWVRARNLKAGMIMHGLAAPAEITSVTVEEVASPSFNLIVDDFHSYFVQVGEKRVFSHDNSLRDPIRTTVPGLNQPLREDVTTAK